MTNMQDDDFDLQEGLVDEFDLEDFDSSPQPVSPIQELAQIVAASTPPITADAPSNAALWAEMSATQTLYQNRLEELAKTDPILSKLQSKDYGIKVNTTPYMKAKEGASKVFIAIIDHILTRSGAEKTQTAIRKYVAETYPSHSIPKDWTKPLPAWAVKKVKRRIQNSPAPISNIQFPKAVTLSQLHKAASAAMERHKTGVLTFWPVVEVGDANILINGIAFPIGANKVKGETYKQVRASMSKLLQALSSGK